MNAMILAGLPQEFDVLAVEAPVDTEAKLEALVRRTDQAAGTGPGRKREMEKVRGKLRLLKIALGTPELALPGKLAHPDNRRRHAFYTDAIARLTTLIEAE